MKITMDEMGDQVASTFALMKFCEKPRNAHYSVACMAVEHIVENDEPIDKVLAEIKRAVLEGMKIK